MFVENLLSKINNALQQLAKMLDLIHKFGSKQREHYFQMIKNLQAQLNTLKSGLKDSNALHTQKLFNSIYLNINSLCTQVQDLSLLLVNKQNRDSNRVQPVRESKKTQEEAFRLIVEKEDEINKLKLELFEKEQLIKINYQELMDYKRQCTHLDQQVRYMKNQINELQRDISRLNQDLLKKEQQVIDFKLVDQERQRLIRNHQEELQHYRKELEEAHHKIQYFQHFTEISMNKTKMVEENIRQLQLQAQNLNQNYKLKEHQNFKKYREIEQLQTEIRSLQVQLNAENVENNQMRQDIDRFQQQIARLQEYVYNMRTQSTKERQDYKKEKEQLTRKLQNVQIEKDRISTELKQSQDKFVDIYNQCSQLQEQNQAFKTNLDKREQEVQQVQEKLKHSQNKCKIAEKQFIFVNKQKEILNQQLSKSLGINKQYENEINKLKQQVKTKQAERIRLASSVQNSTSKLRSLERDKIINQRSLNAFTQEINDYKIKIIKLQEDKKYKEKEIESLNTRYIRAKIEAIHEIRSSFSQL